MSQVLILIYSFFLMKIFRLLAILASINIAVSWNCAGHMISVQIALNLLGEKFVNTHIKPLLNQPGLFVVYDNILQNSCWSDIIARSPELYTLDWHFVNIPLHREEGRDIPLQRPYNYQKINIIWAIDMAIKVLTGNSHQFTKEFMLRYLIHMLGDITQPLHSVSLFGADFPNGDKGGNLFNVYFNGKSSALHHLWDDGFNEFPFINFPISSEDSEKIQKMAEKFQNEYGKEFNLFSMNFDAENIAWESYDIASKFVYAGLEKDSQISEKYVKKAKESIRKRVVATGCYLAFALKEIFQSDGAKLLEIMEKRV